jgi:hypothetical protein
LSIGPSIGVGQRRCCLPMDLPGLTDIVTFERKNQMADAPTMSCK